MIIPLASRLETVQEYFFSRKLKEIARMRAEGKHVINLGIGSPDFPPADTVVEELISHVSQPNEHGYQPYQGIPELRVAMAAFMEEKFGVKFNDTEILPLLGSKEGIMHISLAFLNPGDQVLVPSLGYPSYSAVTRLVGAIPVSYPLLEQSGWEPDWDFLERTDTARVKLMWLNYPHMPTGSKGSEELFRRMVEFAHKRGILLCHDNPYSFILNDEPRSILSIPDAKEVSIELNSMSKTFNMAGWRVGWISGSEKYLDPIMSIKSNMDSGMFKPIQYAAIKATQLSQDWYQSINNRYRDRRRLAYQILDAIGCEYHTDQVGMFLWAKGQETGEILADRLLAEKHLFITPGYIFGEAGKWYIRISLCTPENELSEVLDRLKL